jgi:hypothetical protein
MEMTRITNLVETMILDNDNQDDDKDKMRENYEDYGRIVVAANNLGGIAERGVKSSGDGATDNASFSSEEGEETNVALVGASVGANIVQLLRLWVGGVGGVGTRRARALLSP